MINGPTQVFARRHTGPSGYHDEVFHGDDHVERTLTKILDDAAAAHRTLDPAEGLQDAQLDNGARLHIVHRDGHLLVLNFSLRDEDQAKIVREVVHRVATGDSLSSIRRD